MDFKDIPIGSQFGRLTVTCKSSKKGSHAYWECKCECGNTTVVSGGNLRSGNTTSCGCVWAEKAPYLHRTHGDRSANSEYAHLYKSWSCMIQRCTNPRNTQYSWYGGRGVTIDPEWRQYESFKSWAISHGYQSGYTIDRIDNSKGYSPENCRWATTTVQANNKRNNVRLSINGESHTIAEWSRILGIPATALYQRHKVLNWPDDKILTTPYRKSRRK